MHLIDYVNAFENWEEELSGEPLHLKITHFGEYVMFKYSQIDTDFSYKMAEEARGCIMRKVDGKYEYVCRPFDKFYNYGEEYAAKLDWKYAVVTEKVDGSLMKVWYDNGWHLSTNGTINAFAAFVGEEGKSFGNLFVEGIEAQFGDYENFLKNLCENYTYMFELVSPISRVVIPYGKTEVYYLAARNTKHGFYVNSPLSQLMAVPRQYDIHSLEEAAAIAEKMDWMHEGFVAFDGVNRIKIKSLEWLKAHYVIGNGAMSDAAVIDLMISGEQSELFAYMPELEDRFSEIRDDMEVAAMIADEMIDRAIDEAGQLNRKDFAQYILSNEPKPLQPFAFRRYENHSLRWMEYAVKYTGKQWVQLMDELFVRSATV